MFIRKEFTKAGAVPFTGTGLQPFKVSVAVEAGSGNKLAVDGKEFETGTDFMPLALTSNETLTAPVVFCGYGLIPSGDTLSRDDFAGLDIKGKWPLFSAVTLSGYRGERVCVTQH
jgi:hypothetical protein